MDRGSYITLILIWVVMIVGCDPLGGSSKKVTRPDAAPKVQPVVEVKPDASVALDTKGHANLDRDGTFFGRADWPIRQKLATEPIATVEMGGGGRSVGFKITLKDGTRGYYKPEQTFSAAHWYGEIAAYYLDRELGLGRAPPSVGRILPWRILELHAPLDDRVDEVIVRPDGTVRGVFVWWIPDKLVPLRPGDRWERWLRVSGTWPAAAVSPFQRPRDYVNALNSRSGRNDIRRWATDSDGGSIRVHATMADAGESVREHEEIENVALAPPMPTELPFGMKNPDTPDRVAELSDMILFDYLTLNLDRWGGEFTNVRTKGPGGPLIYLDNAAGFTPNAATNGVMLSRLHAVEKFRRSTVEAIRALDIQKLKRRMSTDPLAPILDDQSFYFIDQRRNHVLGHVANMQAKYGDAVFAW